MLYYLLLAACIETENKYDVDFDGDGFRPFDGDCDDENAEIGPDECSDDDGDGRSEAEGDCDDANPYANIGAAELDSVTDCMLDMDEDGYGDSDLAVGIVAGTKCALSFVSETVYLD